jgi:hypothetical protein
MSKRSGRTWCAVDFGYFDTDDFDRQESRWVHHRNLPAGKGPHFADGRTTSPWHDAPAATLGPSSSPGWHAPSAEVHLDE